jgi:hypothetical protein
MRDQEANMKQAAASRAAMQNTYGQPQVACDEPLRSPAEKMMRAIDNMDDVSNGLNRLYSDLVGGDTHPCDPEAVRAMVSMSYVLQDGPQMLDARRNECMDTLHNLRELLL